MSSSQAATKPVVLIGDGNLRRLADWQLEIEAEYWRREGCAMEAQLGGRTDDVASNSRVFLLNMLAEVTTELERRMAMPYRRAQRPFDLGPIIEAVKARADCLDVFAARCAQSNAYNGRRQQAINAAAVKLICPFHTEKTASLTVFRSSNRWKCFGCGNGGDVIAAVMKLDGLGFVDAVLQLAREYGVNVPTDRSTRPPLLRAVAR